MLLADYHYIGLLKSIFHDIRSDLKERHARHHYAWTRDTMHKAHPANSKGESRWRSRTIIIANWYYIAGLKQSLVYEIVPKDRDTRDHSAWTIGNRYPMPEVCIRHMIPRTCEQQGRRRRGQTRAQRGATPNLTYDMGLSGQHIRKKGIKVMYVAANNQTIDCLIT